LLNNWVYESDYLRCLTINLIIGFNALLNMLVG
jgi:hypothetical protein